MVKDKWGISVFGFAQKSFMFDFNNFIECFSQSFSRILHS